MSGGSFRPLSHAPTVTELTPVTREASSCVSWRGGVISAPAESRARLSRFPSSARNVFSTGST